MRFDFDPAKSEWLRKNPHRRVGFEEAQQIFEGAYYTDLVSEYPEQFRAIGWINDRLIVVIYEVRKEAECELYHLVTLWAATREEKTLYEEHT